MRGCRFVVPLARGFQLVTATRSNVTDKRESERQFTLGYRPALDGVRAVAILAVVAYHYRWANHALPTRGGFLGVDVFFVLSGFLITSLLCEELAKTGRLRLKLFYARRALRLLPAFFTMVAVYVVWVLTLGPDRWVSGQLREAAAAVLYAENWFRAFAPNYPDTGGAIGLGPTWSLSTEEQFYFIWPILLLFLIRLGRLRAASIFVAAALVSSALVRALMYQPQNMDHFFYVRADGLLIGCFLALLLAQGVRRRPPRWIGWIASVVVCLFLITATYDSQSLYTFGLVVFCLACGLVLWVVVVTPEWAIARLLERKPLVQLGRISYGVYLWHLPVFIGVREYVPRIRFAGSLALLLTFLVALGSYRYVERPFLKLKGKLNPAKPPASASPSDLSLGSVTTEVSPI